MIAMIFEFSFDPDRPEIYDEYLTASDRLRQLLPDVDGFIGIERFQSCSDDNKFVAVGFFDDEGAVTAWRNTLAHRRVQALGRNRLFTSYRLRMADVTRDYTATDRTQAPADSRTANDQGKQV
jgi:heme-degrading monooxygenase HmoA